ncbi:MAG: hypothetical protein ACRC8Y_22025 [Chroococcales cyanobacterium]
MSFVICPWLIGGDGAYWEDVRSNDFSRCSSVMADAMTLTLLGFASLFVVTTSVVALVSWRTP